MCLGPSQQAVASQQMSGADYLKDLVGCGKYTSSEAYTTQECFEGSSGSSPSDETPTTDSEDDLYEPRHWSQNPGHPGLYPPAQQTTSTPVQLLPVNMPFMQAPGPASTSAISQPILIPVCMTVPAGFFVIRFPAQSQCSQQQPTNAATIQQPQEQPSLNGQRHMMLQQQPQQQSQPQQPQQQQQQQMQPQQPLQQSMQRERRLAQGTQSQGPAWMQQPSDPSTRLLRLERERPMTKGRMRRQIQRARKRLGKMQEAISMAETVAASSNGLAAAASAHAFVPSASSTSDDL